MKHIKTLNEWYGQKFFTGHEDDNQSDIAEKRIEQELENAIKQYKESPDEFVIYDEPILRQQLLKDARDNGFRGRIIVRTSPNEPKTFHAHKKFIVYDRKPSPVQDLGSLAAQYR